MPLMQPEQANERSWWDDTTGFFGDLFGTVTDAASTYADLWLRDEFGASQPAPETHIERPQAANADISNSPSVAFGFSQTQLLIGGAVVAVAFLLARKK